MHTQTCSRTKLISVNADAFMQMSSRLTQQDGADSPATQVVDGLSEGQASCSLNSAALGKGSCHSGGSSRDLDRAGCDD